MVALCGNCHPPVEKMGRDRQYAIKANPKNVREGVMRGALDFDKRDLTFVVGGNLFTNTPIILRYRQTPIISCTVQDGQAKVSMNLLGPDGQTMLAIVDNDVTFRIDDLWDFEYKHNLATARYGPRDIAPRIDLREQASKIEGKVWLGGHQVALSPSQATLPRKNRIIGCQFGGLAVGIQVGEGSSIGPTAIAVAE